MFPLAARVPAVGRTCMPDQVTLDVGVPLDPSLPLIVVVMVVAVQVIVGDNETLVPEPLFKATIAVTPEGLNSKPVGA